LRKALLSRPCPRWRFWASRPPATRRRIIPDAVSATLALSGAAVCLIGDGWVALAWTAAAAAAVFALCFALFHVDVLGGGDVKFAAAAALWPDPSIVPLFLLLTSIFGGGVALVVAAARLRSRLRAGRSLGMAWRSAIAAPTPYGVAIAASGSAVLPTVG
jgi:prepilin peptidase CpaA